MKHPERYNTDPLNTVNIDAVMPMLEHHVSKHDSLLSDKSERKLGYEDCCNYCEKYGEHGLTAVKQKRIEAWTDNVNATMSNSQGVSLDKTHHKTPKLKFLNSSGTYDRFARRPHSSKSFRHSKLQGKSTLVRRKSFNDKTSLKQESTAQNNDAEVDDLNNNSSSSHQISRNEQEVKSVSKKSLSARSSFTEASTNVSQNTSQISSSKSTQLGSRTTSNNLLNCISIDDSFRQHRRILANASPWMAAKCVQENETIEEAKRQESFSRREKNNGSNTHCEPEVTVPKIKKKSRSNKVVFSGFDALENTNEATNTCAYKGLYKFDKSCNQPLNDPQGSKRFQKINKQLHKMVEDFHLNGSSLSTKLRKWKDGNEAENSTVGDSTYAGSSYSMSRPMSGTSTGSQFSGPSKVVRFRSANRKNWSANSQTRQATTTTTTKLDTGNDGRESFLEMIMDMDQQRNSGQGNLQIQPFLYV